MERCPIWLRRFDARFPLKQSVVFLTCVFNCLFIKATHFRPAFQWLVADLTGKWLLTFRTTIQINNGILKRADSETKWGSHEMSRPRILINDADFSRLHIFQILFARIGVVNCAKQTWFVRFLFEDCLRFFLESFFESSTQWLSKKVMFYLYRATEQRK